MKKEVEDPDENLWQFEVDGRWFMGYFWWHYKKRNNNPLTTWWAFFGPQLKREWVSRFFYSVGFAIGLMMARLYIIPEDMQFLYTIDYPKK